MHHLKKRSPSLPWSGLLVLAILLAWPGGGGLAQAMDATPRLEDLLAAVGEYVVGYQADFQGVMAEEKYVQRWEPSAHNRPYNGLPEDAQPNVLVRRLYSDVLLIRPPRMNFYKMYRDVYKVDRRTLNDGERRFSRLLASGEASLEQIVEESACYNLGDIKRNFNLPLTALYLLEPRNQKRLRFSLGPAAMLGEVRTWRVDFTEARAPTFFDYNGMDVIVSGAFWVEPDTGRVFQSTIRLEPEGKDPLRAVLTERYAFQESIGMLAPVTMEEEYHYLPVDPHAAKLKFLSSLTGTATYTNFRRCVVSDRIVFPVVDTVIRYDSVPSEDGPTVKK